MFESKFDIFPLHSSFHNLTFSWTSQNPTSCVQCAFFWPWCLTEIYRRTNIHIHFCDIISQKHFRQKAPTYTLLSLRRGGERKNITESSQVPWKYHKVLQWWSWYENYSRVSLKKDSQREYPGKYKPERTSFETWTFPFSFYIDGDY